MNIKESGFLLVISFLLFSCQKPVSPLDETKQDTSKLAKFSMLLDDIPPLKNYVILYYHKRAELPQYARESDNSVSVIGSFYDAGNNYVSVGNLHVNDLSIPPNAYNAYSYASNLQYGGVTREARVTDVSNAYGQDVTVAIDGGSGYPASSNTVHVPSDLQLLASAYEKYAQNSNLNLTWTPDPQNQFGEVLINVYYNPGLSLYQNGSNPPSVASLIYLVPDNGSYSIPASSMSRFPGGSFIGYSVARANEYEVDPVNDIMIYTVTEVESNALLVVPAPDIYVRMERDGEYYYSDEYSTVQSAYYYIRFYQNYTCTTPVVLWADICVPYHYRNTSFDNNGYYSEYNMEGIYTGARGETQVDLGYTERYYYSGGYGTTNEYWISGGPAYSLVN